jgi:hypothetical protein
MNATVSEGEEGMATDGPRRFFLTFNHIGS